MKIKFSIGILVMLVSMIMLMSNVLGSGWPVVWINQATLSTVDSNTSEDPENSGFGTIQAAVWEEWNGNDWDIYMKYSLLDGALGSWVFPVIHPAITGLNETNPAVTVTNINPQTGFTEIHVVYQRQNTNVINTWDICHTWTNNFGITWTVPVILDNNVLQDAIDPAIVYTEDFSNPVRGMLVQIVWSELNPNPLIATYEIQYNAYYYDPTLPPPGRGYVGAILIQGAATGAGGDCLHPEIASIDEIFTPAYDYYFAIVWEENVFLRVPPVWQWNVMYVDGITMITPWPPVWVLGVAGQLSTNAATHHSYDPDIAVSQDYAVAAPFEQYYFQVDWVHYTPAAGGIPQSWQIDTSYCAGFIPMPGAVSFVPQFLVQSSSSVLDRPTIAVKLGNNIPTFQAWIAWEDSSNGAATNPDIWFRVGWYCFGLNPPWSFMVPPTRVGYVPGAGGGSIEYNPELWNRNDLSRPLPPLTHLVFDQDLGAGTPEVVYIDP